MGLIAGLWWLWLTIARCSIAYALRVQYLRARALSEHVGHTVTSILNGDPEMIGNSAQRITNDLAEGFFLSLGRFVVAIIIAVISSVLLLISLIVHIINYIVTVY